jgi:hypothetical protein
MSWDDREEVRRAAGTAYLRGEIIEGRKAAIATFTEGVKLYSAFNAGGLVALLGFLGAIAGKTPGVLENVNFLIHPMLAFGGGLAASGVSAFCYYVTRLSYVEEYMRANNGSGMEAQRFLMRGLRFQRVATILAMTSLVLFIAGLGLCVPLIQVIKL